MVGTPFYLLTVPLGIIALSGWLVKMESDSFLNSRRTVDIQQSPKLWAPHRIEPVPAPAILRLSHDRYGVGTESSPLGASPSHRTLGSRGSIPTDWLRTQIPKPRPGSGSIGEFAEIPGYIAEEQVEPTFETVPVESGFRITAEEATKLDGGADKVIFSGKVGLTSAQFQLASDKLTVFLNKDKKSFRIAEATGNVRVQLTGVPEDKRYRGQSRMAVYDPKQQMLTMIGWPRIQGQGQELVAAEESTKVFLYTGTGQMLTQGRAQTRLAKQFVDAESGR